MEESCILTYKAANMMKGRCYKSVNSKGETTDVIIIDHTEVNKDYVITYGTYANSVNNTIVIKTGKMNIAMRIVEGSRTKMNEPIEYGRYVLYDTISEISLTEAKEFINNMFNTINSI